MKKIMAGKRGNLSSVDKYIIYFIGLVVLFKLVAALLPEAQDAGDDLNASGAPLGSFFTSDGVIWLIVMAGIALVVIRGAMSKSRK